MNLHEKTRVTMTEADRVAAHLGTRLIFANWFATARAEIELNAGEVEPALRLAQVAINEAHAAGGVFSEAIAQRIWGRALVVANQYPGCRGAPDAGPRL